MPISLKFNTQIKFYNKILCLIKFYNHEKMSANCCQNKSKDLENIQKQHSNILWIVLFINLIMFVIELVSGFRAKSPALTGDSLDMLGDALVYGSSIFDIY